MNREAETDLIARCRRGEAQAWDELFDRNYAAAGRFVFQLAGDLTREDVDEICQETFLAVGGGQTTVSLQAEDPENGLLVDPPSGAPTPDATVMNTERILLLREALDQLGQPCREIIELRYFGDLSYDEISNILQLNVKTVSSRLSKCLDRLEEIARMVFSREKTTPYSV